MDRKNPVNRNKMVPWKRLMRYMMQDAVITKPDDPVAHRVFTGLTRLTGMERHGSSMPAR